MNAAERQVPMGIFDEMADRYDTPDRIQVADVNAKALQNHIGHSGKEKTAIDYGCGTGLVGLQLAGCFRRLLLVDSSPEMIRVVQKKIAESGFSNVQTLCTDFSIGTPPGLSADIVFLVQTLLHIPDTEAILRHLHGLLNPGGHLLVVDFDKNEAVSSDLLHNGFLQADLAAQMRRIGFADVSSKTIYHGKNIFMNQDASLFLMDAVRPKKTADEL